MKNVWKRSAAKEMIVEGVLAWLEKEERERLEEAEGVLKDLDGPGEGLDVDLEGVVKVEGE